MHQFSLTGGPLHVSISYQKVDSNAEYENDQNSGKEIIVDKEERIRQLEGQLSNMKMSSSYGSNCEGIARIQLQLTQKMIIAFSYALRWTSTYRSVNTNPPSSIP